ncbi:MAG: glycosyltransferase [Planctomycetota bacterium]
MAPDKVRRIFNAYHGPNVQDVPESRAEAREQLGLQADARYLLTICRLMVWKRVDGIIEALSHLPGDVHLLVAGDGDQERNWKRFAADLGLGDRVHFLGNVPHAQIPLYIRAADIFVLNSEYEGLSHTLLEVQALGTPMVASGVCGNPEVVEDGINGLLVDPADPQTLVVALSRLLENPALRDAYAAEALTRVGEFTREGTFGQVEQVLQSLAKA